MASISNGTTTITDLPLIGVALQRVTATAVHNVIGRSSPIAVLGTISARSGVLTFRVASLSTIESVVTLVQGKRCVLTTTEQPALTGMPLVVTDLDYRLWDRGTAGWWWDLQVAFAEVS